MSNPSRRRLSFQGLALVALASFAGCSKNAGPPAPDPQPPAGSPARAAQTLPLPGTAAPQNPHGEGGDGGGRLVWDAPAGWTSQTPRSSMRLAQYLVPGEAGAAECITFYFGPGQGGDPASNATRWAEQFEQPDGRSSVDVMQMTELDKTHVPLYIVEVTGTYDGGMTMTDAPAEKQPGSMLLGGIAQGADAWWFFKLTGPEATVRAQRDAFVAMMRSVRPEP